MLSSPIRNPSQRKWIQLRRHSLINPFVSEDRLGQLFARRKRISMDARFDTCCFNCKLPSGKAIIFSRWIQWFDFFSWTVQQIWQSHEQHFLTMKRHWISVQLNRPSRQEKRALVSNIEKWKKYHYVLVFTFRLFVTNNELKLLHVIIIFWDWIGKSQWWPRSCLVAWVSELHLQLATEQA